MLRSSPQFTVHYCGGYLIGMVGHHSKMNTQENMFESKSHSASCEVDFLIMADTSDVRKGVMGLSRDILCLGTDTRVTVHSR